MDTLGISYFNSSEMVAGRLERVPGAEIQTAWQRAANAAQAEILHLVVHEVQDWVYWLAVPSRALASADPDSVAAFASVMPGGPNDPGTGMIYTITCSDRQSEISALVRTQDGSLRLLTGPAARLNTYLSSFGLPIVDLDRSDILAQLRPVPWAKIAMLEEKAVREGARRTILASAVATIAFAVIAMFSAAATLLISVDSTVQIEKNTQHAKSLLEQAINASQDNMITHIQEMVEIEREVFRLGGRKLTYRYSPTEGVRWEATFPASVNSATLDALKARIQEYTEDGRIIVTN